MIFLLLTDGSSHDRVHITAARRKRSVIGLRLLGRGVDDDHVGDGAFVGFQTLNKRPRAFFILRQGKERLTLATV